MGLDDVNNEPKLKSLAQAARGKELNTARYILFGVGILSLVVNIGLFFFFQSQIEDARKRGDVLDPQAIAMFKIIVGVSVAISVSYIIFGFLVKTFPVPVTIIALVLYVGDWLVGIALNPATAHQGIIIKIAIVIAMFKAVQAAFAYQKELQRERDDFAPDTPHD